MVRGRCRSQGVCWCFSVTVSACFYVVFFVLAAKGFWWQRRGERWQPLMLGFLTGHGLHAVLSQKALWTIFQVTGSMHVFPPCRSLPWGVLSCVCTTGVRSGCLAEEFQGRLGFRVVNIPIKWDQFWRCLDCGLKKKLTTPGGSLLCFWKTQSGLERSPFSPISSSVVEIIGNPTWGMPHCGADHCSPGTSHYRGRESISFATSLQDKTLPDRKYKSPARLPAHPATPTSQIYSSVYSDPSEVGLSKREKTTCSAGWCWV